jgi:hypothetical protein
MDYVFSGPEVEHVPEALGKSLVQVRYGP